MSTGTTGKPGKQLRVTIVQSGSCSEDLAANTAALLETFREEAAKGTDLVLFPELATAPYFCATSKDDRFWDWAETVPGPTTDAFAKVAAETGTAVCFGIYERTPEGVFYNAAPIIDGTGTMLEGRLPDGTTQATFRKLAIPKVETPTLTTDEKHWYGPGAGPCIFELNGIRVAILLCYDRSFSEHWMAAAHMGAEAIIVVVSSFGWRSELFLPELRIRGMEAGVWVLAVNRGGPEVVNGQTLTFFGQSCVIEPTGKVVALAPADEAGHVIHATIDTGIIAEARRTWPIQQDRRPEVFRFMYDTAVYAPPAGS
jgi:beta-ureidopropionase